MSKRVPTVDASITIHADLNEASEVNGSKIDSCLAAAETRAALVLDRPRGLSRGADEHENSQDEKDYVLARAGAQLRRAADGAAAGSTVLVIDDSAAFRDRLGRALEAAGYRVAAASSGEEGLRVALEVRPAAMIVDEVLPAIDGRTVILRVRLDAALRLTPCLLLTASDGVGTEVEALEGGADACVGREEDIAVILARLAAILRSAPGESPQAAPATSLAPRRILAVDDNTSYLQGLALALMGEDYELVLAHSGEEALELLQVQPVACILLDLLMPGLSGHETCQRIKAQAGLRGVPVIVLTALEERAAMIEAFAAGADDFISKSADVDVLCARVRTKIQRCQFEEESVRLRENDLRMEMEAADVLSGRRRAEMRKALVEELTQQNRALWESEERLMGVVETIAEGVLIVGADGRISFANAMAEKLVGLPKEVITQRTHDALSWKVTSQDGEPVPEGESPIARVLRTAEPVYGVGAAIERPDGGRVEIQVNASPIRSTDGELTGVIATVSDLTQPKVEQIKDTLLSAVLHELRTPLTRLMPLTEQMLQQDCPTEQRQKYLSIVHGESALLSSLIDDLLDQRRSESC